MRNRATKHLELFRIDGAPGGIDGRYLISTPTAQLRVIASSGRDWSEVGLDGEPFEHVSVSLPHRTPTWAEMDLVRRMFWLDDETVMQLHVPRSQHVNIYPHCLHLWRPLKSPIPCPPLECV